MITIFVCGIFLIYYTCLYATNGPYRDHDANRYMFMCHLNIILFVLLSLQSKYKKSQLTVFDLRSVIMISLLKQSIALCVVYFVLATHSLVPHATPVYFHTK